MSRLRWIPAFLVLQILFSGVLATPRALADDVNAVSDDTPGVEETTSVRRQQPEPSIAINPRNSLVIAGGAQDFRRAAELRAACGGDRWNGLYLSTNGGQTWTNSLVPGFCTDATQGAGSEQAASEMFGFSTNTDPVLVFDRFGNLYYSHIAFNADPFRTIPPSTSGVLFVSTYRVTDAGVATHAKTVKVPSGSGLRKTPFVAGPGIFSNFDDKQWMAVDNTETSPFFGRVYVTWTKFSAQGGFSSIWVSHCGGDGPGDRACMQFTRGKVLNKPVAGGLVQESFPATGPNGELYIAFLQFQGGFGSTLPHSGIWILKSTDGGETATQQKIADIRQIPSPIPPAGTSANDGLNSFRTGTTPGVAVTADGTIHVVWGEWVGGTNAEVRYVRSTDGGQTWSGPISMNDVSAGHQFFPAITASGSDVHVAWYDSRFNTGGAISALDVFYNRSTNAGATFAPDVRITDQSFNPNQVSRFPVFCAAFIGDYIDIDAVGDTVAVIWNDNRNVVNPLSPAECADFRTRSTDPSIQGRLDSGALDQEAFVDIIEQP